MKKNLFILFIGLSLGVFSCKQAPETVATKIRPTSVSWPGTGTSCTDMVGPLHNRILNYIGHHLNSTWVDSSYTGYLNWIERLASQFASDSLGLSGSSLSNFNFGFAYGDKIIVDTVKFGGSYLLWPYSKNLIDSCQSYNLINSTEYNLLIRYVHAYSNCFTGSISDGALYDTVQALLSVWSGISWPSGYGILSGGCFKLFNASYGFWNGSKASSKHSQIQSTGKGNDKPQMALLALVAGADAVGFCVGGLVDAIFGSDDETAEDCINTGIADGAGASAGMLAGGLTGDPLVGVGVGTAVTGIVQGALGGGQPSGGSGGWGYGW